MEIEKGSELDDQAVISILQKEVKTRQEAIDESAARRATRPGAGLPRGDRWSWKNFFPSQMSPAELEELAGQVIAELGVTSQREMGQVMKNPYAASCRRASGRAGQPGVRKLLGIAASNSISGECELNGKGAATIKQGTPGEAAWWLVLVFAGQPFRWPGLPLLPAVVPFLLHPSCRKGRSPTGTTAHRSRNVHQQCDD